MVGVNEDGYYFMNVNFECDFYVEVYVDICFVQEGELLLDGVGVLKFIKGIEIGYIFKFGICYFKDLYVEVLDVNGCNILVIMGCYGIGVLWLLFVIVE